jgi:hypothetical protein
MQTIHRHTVQIATGSILVEGASQEAVKAVSDSLISVAKVPYFSGLMLARSIRGENDAVSARYVKTRAPKAETKKAK